MLTMMLFALFLFVASVSYASLADQHETVEYVAQRLSAENQRKIDRITGQLTYKGIIFWEANYG